MVVSLPLQPRRVINGFIAGGAVDEITRQWPDFDKIIATCRRDVKKEEVDCIITNFTRLYNAFLQHGKVPEEIYDEIGLDEDMDGNCVIRLRRSDKDCLQRAMCLSAPALREGRRKLLEQAKEQQRVRDVG